MFKFTYVKNENDVSERELVVLRQPSANYFGLDLSTLEDLHETEKLDIEYRIHKFMDRQHEEFNQLIHDLGLEATYRTFKRDKMVTPEEK